MNENDYPTDEELETIRGWDFNKGSVMDFLAFIESVWHWPDWGYELKGKRILRLELHTRGLSENESVMSALKANSIFWIMCWEKSVRGGRYYFRISLKAFKE